MHRLDTQKRGPGRAIGINAVEPAQINMPAERVLNTRRILSVRGAIGIAGSGRAALRWTSHAAAAGNTRKWR